MSTLRDRNNVFAYLIDTKEVVSYDTAADKGTKFEDMVRADSRYKFIGYGHVRYTTTLGEICTSSIISAFFLRI